MNDAEVPPSEGSTAGMNQSVTQIGADSGVVAINSRRELFIDDFIIERLGGDARLRLHHPDPQEIAIVHDRPWEGSSCGYHTVFRDGDIFRMYYRGLHVGKRKEFTPEMHEPFYCYAESEDGIEWRRPELGIVEFEGSKENNIILKGVGTHNFSPFKDTNRECAPEARYKALGGTKKEGGLHAFRSQDGIHWSLMADEPVITDGAFDSQNVAFWDPNSGRYRAYWRYFTEDRHRAIRTGTSIDFLDWGGNTDLAYLDSPLEHLYTNQVKPYYRAPHILVGFPTRYVDRGWSDSMRALPELDDRELRASANQRYGTAVTEGLLMASRDGVNFKRWNEAFLRPGIQRPGTWMYGHQYIARHLVETESPISGAPKEISLYSTEGHPTGVSVALRRYTLRMDGFVSVWAPSSGGDLLTRPLTFAGSELGINFSTSAVGRIRVELQDPEGNAIPGYSLGDCPDIFGDEVERCVNWESGKGPGELSGEPVRILFALNDADLYSFRFSR